jgi:hypothetical protein
MLLPLKLQEPQFFAKSIQLEDSVDNYQQNVPGIPFKK